MEADYYPAALASADAATPALLIDITPAAIIAMGGKPAELLDGYSLATCRTQRAWVLASFVELFAPFRYPLHEHKRAGQLASALLACERAVPTFGWYLDSLQRANRDGEQLAPGIRADAACDFQEVRWEMTDVDLLADACLFYASKFARPA